MDWECIKQIIIRIRRKNGYRQPNSLKHLNRLIKKKRFNDMVVEVVRVEEDEALLFTSQTLLKELNEQTELFMDGTFDVI